MFDLEEAEKLRAMGVHRVRWPDGSELEFDPFAFERPPSGQRTAAAENEPPAPAQMPSREELRAEVAKLTPDADGAPAVTP